MTLNQTIINQWGVWQCSDHRVTNPATGEIVDDYSVKQIILQCTDGTALLAYAGAGKVSSVDLSDWIRETIRGESYTLDQTLILIRENATRDLAPHLLARGIRHMFSIGAFLAGRPWAIQIRNFNAPSGVPSEVVLNRFETIAKVVDPGQGLVFIYPHAILGPDQRKLMTLANRKPRTPKEFRDLLASINRRFAATPSGRKTVSPGCVTSYMPPKGQPVESEFHGGTAGPTPLVIPTLLFGIDTTEIQRTLMERMKRMNEVGAVSSSPDNTGLSPQQERAAKESVLPRNRLRPGPGRPKK